MEFATIRAIPGWEALAHATGQICWQDAFAVEITIEIVRTGESRVRQRDHDDGGDQVN